MLCFSSWARLKMVWEQTGEEPPEQTKVFLVLRPSHIYQSLIQWGVSALGAQSAKARGRWCPGPLAYLCRATLVLPPSSSAGTGRLPLSPLPFSLGVAGGSITCEEKGRISCSYVNYFCQEIGSAWLSWVMDGENAKAEAGHNIFKAFLWRAIAPTFTLPFDLCSPWQTSVLFILIVHLAVVLHLQDPLALVPWPSLWRRAVGLWWWLFLW